MATERSQGVQHGDHEFVDRARSRLRRLREGARRRPWLALACVAFVLLILLAVYVWSGWNPPSFFQREFSWFDASELEAYMSVGFQSDGPLAAGNPIFVTGAQFTLMIYVTPGPVEVEIAGDLANSTGTINFWLPTLANGTPGFPTIYGTGTVVTRDAGHITPSVSGTLRLFAWIRVTGVAAWQGWSQGSPSVDLAPSGDYYTFLGLKATAATVLTAAAFTAFPALESARRLWQKAPVSPERPKD